jgi:RNA polymerase nonessential primary-like sigma factor
MAVSDLVGVYLREMGRVPLLTVEEEVKYGSLVRQFERLKGALYETKPESLQEVLLKDATYDQIVAVLQTTDAIVLDGETYDRATCLQLAKTALWAKDKMQTANLRLVVNVAKKYLGRGVEFLDLIQEGTMGLGRAIDKFEPEKGYKFSTYAYWWIRQGITRSIANSRYNIRLPIHVTERLNKIKAVRQRLAQVQGHTATSAEVAAAIGMTPKALIAFLDGIPSTSSLNAMVGEDSEFQDFIPDSKDMDADLEMRSMQESLANTLHKLKDRERDVLSLRYGLTDGKCYSLAEIGLIYNCTRERVRQVELNALLTLRKKAKHLKVYLYG